MNNFLAYLLDYRGRKDLQFEITYINLQDRIMGVIAMYYLIDHASRSSGLGLKLSSLLIYMHLYSVVTSYSYKTCLATTNYLSDFLKNFRFACAIQ